MSDRKSWAIKDEAILDDLAVLINLTAEEKEILANLQAQAQIIAPALSEAFYQRLLAHPETAEFVVGQIEQRKTTLETWFVQLFSGCYDEEYVWQRLKIGQTHVRIGLPVRYPLAMMDIVLECGRQVAAQSEHPERASQAIRKLLALDVAIFNQAYEDAKLKHLAEMMGNERLARRLLTQ
jgi:hypothetical protein